MLVHELAHQWFGDSLAVDTWQNIWLNEGFATYAEWLWSEHEGYGTAQEIFDDFAGIPADDEFWEPARSATQGRTSCSTSRSTPAAR